MKALLSIAITMIAFLSFGQNCDKVLERGVFNTYNFKSIKTLNKTLKRVTELSFEEFKSLAESSSVDAGVSALWGIISADANVESQKQTYEKIKLSYKENFDFHINTNEEQEIAKVIASKEILDAWRECIRSSKPISHTVQNSCEHCDNCETNFTASIIYKRTAGSDEKKLKITNVTVQNASFVRPVIFKKGATIPEFSSITQQFSKSSTTSPVTIVVDFDGRENLTIILESCKARLIPLKEVIQPTAYTLEIKTNWEVIDDDSNDAATSPGDEHRDGIKTENVTLHVGSEPVKINFSECTDNEVRVDAHYFLKVSESRELELITGSMAIFEGNSCGQAVHEKTELIAYKKLPMGDAEIFAQRIDDKQFDWGRIVVRAKLLKAE